MAGIDFMSIAKGAEYANTLNQKDDAYYRQRQTDMFNFDKTQQEFAQKQQEYGLADDARIAGESMLNLNQSVKRLVNETGIDPAQAWIQALQNASLEGATPRQQALFQQSLQKHASILAAEAARAGRLPEADRFLTAAGLPSLTDSEGIALAQDPAKRDAFLATRGFQVVDGKVRLSDGKEYDAGLIAAQIRTGGGTLAMSMAERNKFDESARLAGVQSEGLTAQQAINTNMQKQEIALNLARTRAGLVAQGQPTEWLDSLAVTQGIDLGQRAAPVSNVPTPTAQPILAPAAATVPMQTQAPISAQTQAPVAPPVYETVLQITKAANSLADVESAIRKSGKQLPPELKNMLNQQLMGLSSVLQSPEASSFKSSTPAGRAALATLASELQVNNVKLLELLQPYTQ